MTFQTLISDALRGVPVLGYRLWLSTPGLFATVPDLRRAWGHCLDRIDPYVYRAVFRVQNAGDNQASPRYLIRPAPPDPRVNPALDVYYFGNAAQHADALLQAWFMAAQFGLRPDKDQARIPFRIQHVYGLDASGNVLANAAQSRSFRLNEIGKSTELRLLESISCRLTFPTSTCSRKTKADYQAAKRTSQPIGSVATATTSENDNRYTLHQKLDLEKIATAIVQRLKSYHLEPHAVNWKKLEQQVSLQASTIPSEWQGEDFDLVIALSPTKAKWLEAQQRFTEVEESVEVRQGIRGKLELKTGVGPLASLILAGTYMHIGKGYVDGAGQYQISLGHLDVAEQNGNSENPNF
jgi:hypothetical protein